MVIRAIHRIAAWKYTPFAYVLLVVVGLLNLYLTMRLPDQARANPHAELLVDATVNGIGVAQVAIWLLAMRGASDLMAYAQNIKHTRDGRGITDIARALLWLIVYIVLVPLTSVLAELSVHGPHRFALVVMRNHLPLLAMVAAVGYLFRGSRALVGLTTPSTTQRQWRRLVLAGFAVIAALFVWHFYATVPAMLTRHDQVRFALPVQALLFSYVLPHIAVWLVGTMALLNLWRYSTQVAGHIYRQLFRNLYQGIFLVFIGTFVAQLVIASTASPNRITIWTLLVYTVLLLAIFGYFLIYRGVQRLVKLEAVT